MTNENNLSYFFIFKEKKWFLFSIVLIIILSLVEANGQGDFHIFLSASKDLIEKENIYTNNYNQYYHYFYDLSFALILYPLTFLPIYFAKLIWLLFNGFLLFRIWKLIRAYLPQDAFTKKGEVLVTILSFVFVLRVLQANLHLAQLTIFILFLTLEAIHQIQVKKRHYLGGFLLAWGICIKLLPIVFIPYLIFRAEWKGLLFTTINCLFILFIPVLFIGIDFNFFLLNERWKLINPSNKQHILDTEERSFHSLTTLISTLFYQNTGEQFVLSYKRNIAELSIDQIAKVILIVRLIFVGFTLYFLNSLPFREARSRIQSLYEISYICSIIPLIFPHQQHYAFFFILPSVVYLFYYYNHRFIRLKMGGKISKWVFIVLISISYLALNCHLLLGSYREIYDHFKILTYGAILLILILGFCRPKFIEISK
ncbi:MAG: glycosyltransferase family 87 protein [Fluviicola sp.]|jgi:hypothetical protein